MQQSPWLSIAIKQLQLVGRYMVELGLAPASRSRVITGAPTPMNDPVQITLVGVSADADRFTLRQHFGGGDER